MQQRTLNILQKCKSIKQVKQTHLQLFVNGLHDNNFILPKLITLSSNLRSLDYAIQIFQKSQNPNVITCNNMIKCLTGKTHNGGLRVYNHMKASKIMPNGFTFTFLLRGFEYLEEIKDGMVLHGEIVKLGFGSSVFVQNTLLDFYAKCGGNLGHAFRVFEEMPERDVVSWNSMIGACLANGKVESAIQVFDSMPERNIVTWNCVVSGLSKAGNMELACSVFDRMLVRNEVSWNSMISGYAKAGDVKTAQCIFDQMPEKSVFSWTALITGYTMVGDVESASNLFYQMPVKNVVTWNVMISGYVHSHIFDQALNVFHQMLIDGRCRPDQSTLVSVLCACSHLGSLEHGKWIDSYIKKNKIELSNPLGNALIDMFAKCGDVEGAKTVFNKMANRCIITWTTIISGLAINGQCREALDIFDRMCFEQIKPDDVIFVSVLSACAHGGLVEEGRRVFDQMVQEFDIKPRIEHYGCMVDLLGRAGKLEEAIKFIESMHLEPNAVIWANLLGSCKIHGNGELLELLARKILDQEPSNPSYLMLMSYMSASIGHWEDSFSFRAAMRQQGTEKVPGCSLIQIGNKVHEFLAKDTKHKQRKEIYCALCSLNGHLKQVCDTL